jgi:hypothetical protein
MPAVEARQDFTYCIHLSDNLQQANTGLGSHHDDMEAEDRAFCARLLEKYSYTI